MYDLIKLILHRFDRAVKNTWTIGDLVEDLAERRFNFTRDEVARAIEALTMAGAINGARTENGQVVYEKIPYTESR